MCVKVKEVSFVKSRRKVQRIQLGNGHSGWKSEHGSLALFSPRLLECANQKDCFGLRAGTSSPFIPSSFSWSTFQMTIYFIKKEYTKTINNTQTNMRWKGFQNFSSTTLSSQYYLSHVSDFILLVKLHEAKLLQHSYALVK